MEIERHSNLLNDFECVSQIFLWRDSRDEHDPASALMHLSGHFLYSRSEVDRYMDRHRPQYAPDVTLFHNS
ncbi:hypothetical protein RDMS_08210 [Deinococcus sp. RL]|nr:hypothetical protein RDMS_08210 [Deinococcus sp. RL]